MREILQLLIEGLLLGGVYALLSLGLNLIFGVTRIVLFVYGELLMLFMYGGYLFWTGTGLDPYLAFPVLLIVAAVGGTFLYEVLFRRLVRAGHLSQILATLGLAYALQSLALLLWTADVRSVRSALTGRAIIVADAYISLPYLLACAVGLIVSLLLLVFLRYSHLGLAIRAVAQDRIGAQLSGIPLDRIYRISFVIGMILIALSATFMLPIFTVFPTVGLDFVLLAFVIVVLGGMGSIAGGIASSFVVSLVQSFSGYFIGIEWQNLVYFALFVFVLVVKPAGLAGIRGTEQLGE